ncbi:MAG: signal peptidase I [Bacteroidales bacterium]|nr:signal peptidase I [Bacteroidales bacterium]
MSLKEVPGKSWIKFGFWATLYLLWVIWLGNWWWIIGLAVIFDYNVTGKVNWTFWKKEYREGEKPNMLLDWLDAIIFAVVVVTFINIFFIQSFKIPSSSMESTLYTGDHLFVEKLTYGPRLPQTVLSVPFTHNVLPGGKESYSTLIQNDYRRLAGYRDVKRGDIVVFGFPNGDTVLTRCPAEDYHALCRMAGRENVISQYGPVVARPMDKKDHYVKRCVAVAGDSLKVVDGYVWVRACADREWEKQEVWPGVQYTCTVTMKSSQKLPARILDELGVNVAELVYDPYLPGYPQFPLTEDMRQKVENFSSVESVRPNIDTWPSAYDDSFMTLFPFIRGQHWTRDNYGPIWIPSKGTSIDLTPENLPFYSRIITAYEGNTLELAGEDIIINGEKAETYTFRQDYYFMMGDNRHNSLDSRYWGFVPEDHVVGRPAMVWLSTDGNRQFPKSIRWKRFFKFV